MARTLSSWLLLFMLARKRQRVRAREGERCEPIWEPQVKVVGSSSGCIQLAEKQTHRRVVNVGLHSFDSNPRMTPRALSVPITSGGGGGCSGR